MLTLKFNVATFSDLLDSPEQFVQPLTTTLTASFDVGLQLPCKRAFLDSIVMDTCLVNMFLSSLKIVEEMLEQRVKN